MAEMANAAAGLAVYVARIWHEISFLKGSFWKMLNIFYNINGIEP
jgi:hypothetical protein